MAGRSKLRPIVAGLPGEPSCCDRPVEDIGSWWLGPGQAGREGQAGWDRDEWDVWLSDGASAYARLTIANGVSFINGLQRIRSLVIFSPGG